MAMFDDSIFDKLESTPEPQRKEPVLVCFYSGGLKHAPGMETMKEVIIGAKAFGMTRAMVIGHSNHYKMYGEGYDHWPAYIDKVIQDIDITKDYKERPLILFGHSKGCEVAMSVASRLGDRVLKVYVASTGPIRVGKPTRWENLSKEFKQSGEPGLLKFLSDLNPENALLARTAELSPAEIRQSIEGSKMLGEMMNILRVQYQDAMFPRMTGSDPHIRLISAPIVAISPILDDENLPHMMADWTENTTGQFQLITVNAGHSDVLSNPGLMERLGPDMAATAEDPASCPPIPYFSAAEQAHMKRLRWKGESQAKHIAAKPPKQEKKIKVHLSGPNEVKLPEKPYVEPERYFGENLRIAGFFNQWSTSDNHTRMTKTEGQDYWWRHELTVKLDDGCLSFQVLSCSRNFNFRLHPTNLGDDGFFRLVPTFPGASAVGGVQVGDGDNFYISEAPGTVVTIFCELRFYSNAPEDIKVWYDVEQEVEGDFVPPLAPSFSISQAQTKQLPVCRKLMPSGDRLEIIPSVGEHEDYHLRKQAGELSKRVFGKHRFTSRDLSSGKQLAVVAYEGHTKALGYLVYKVSKSERVMYIKQTAILEGFRSKGLGRALVSWAMLKAESSNCEAMRLNAEKDADDFWRALGFAWVEPGNSQQGYLSLSVKGGPKVGLSNNPLGCVWGVGNVPTSAVAKPQGNKDTEEKPAEANTEGEVYCQQKIAPEQMWPAYKKWHRSSSPGVAKKVWKHAEEGPTLLSVLAGRPEVAAEITQEDLKSITNVYAQLTGRDAGALKNA